MKKEEENGTIVVGINNGFDNDDEYVKVDVNDRERIQNAVSNFEMEQVEKIFYSDLGIEVDLAGLDDETKMKVVKTLDRRVNIEKLGYKFITADEGSYDDEYWVAGSFSELVQGHLDEIGLITCNELGVHVCLDDWPLEEKRKIIEELDLKAKIIEKAAKEGVIYTHKGDDLDNRMAIEMINRECKKLDAIWRDLRVERVAAGKVFEGGLNVDTGGHIGNQDKGDTVVIDGNPEEGVKSAVDALYRLGFKVPKQIRELADAMPKIDPMDTRTGLALVRYADNATVWEMAEKGLLDKSLTDEQLEEFGLTEAHKKQEEIVEKAKTTIEENVIELEDGKKVAIIPGFLKSGAIIAYALGVDYYVSCALDDKNNVKTFAITAKEQLPENMLEFGKTLSEKYKREDGKSSDVFVHPKGNMIVAGGNKNPEFRIDEGTTMEAFKDQTIGLLVDRRKGITANDIGEAGFNTSLQKSKEANAKVEEDMKPTREDR